MKTRVLTLALAAALGLSACGGAGQGDAQSSAPQPAATSAPAGQAAVVDTVKERTSAAPAVADHAVVDQYGLSGKSVVEIVDGMDETNQHRGSGLNGSIRADHLLLKDEKGGDEVSIPVPDDLFYLSVAPYVNQTHECFNHSLTGCVGEFANAQMQAKITQDDGSVLFEGPVTTFENGFVGFWLPRDMQGTLSFSYDGKSVEAPISTDAKSPTCVTTMQLT